MGGRTAIAVGENISASVTQFVYAQLVIVRFAPGPGGSETAGHRIKSVLESQVSKHDRIHQHRQTRLVSLNILSVATNL